jgi:hypothetical protein
VGKAVVEYSTRKPPTEARYELDADCSYYFGETADGTIKMGKIDLGSDERTSQGRSMTGTPRVGTIDIKILVDDDEPAKRRLWEDRLRKRVALASDILEKQSYLRLAVVAAETWSTDNRTNDFGTALGEFERQVNPAPARLAIGFTSQYEIPHGRMDLGGTRGPLHSHILLREWSQHIPEPQRVELLLHELGHYLGAAHSPEPQSVMRPVLVDATSRARSHPVQFDPVNTLIIFLVSEEIRARNIRQFSELSPGTARRLQQIYGELSRTDAQDSVAAKYAQRLNSRPTKPTRPQPATRLSPLARDTRGIVRAISGAAVEARGGPQSAADRMEKDELTEYCFRHAAESAAGLPAETRSKAFLLGLGIALDDSQVLRLHPRTQQFVRVVESNSERSARIQAVGQPTMRGRRDLAQHFVVSAYLGTVVGSQAAEAAGLAKELADARGTSGFSFADLVADEAGILFAKGVLEGHISLIDLAQNYRVHDYMPQVDALPEGLSWEQLGHRFKLSGPPDYEPILREAQQHVAALPFYQQRMPQRAEARAD